jgi:hypothetical protein
MMCMVDTISMKNIPQDDAAPEPLLQARIPQNLKRRVAAVAALKGGSSRDIVIEALEDFLPRAEKEAAVLAGASPKR